MNLNVQFSIGNSIWNQFFFSIFRRSKINSKYLVFNREFNVFFQKMLTFWNEKKLNSLSKSNKIKLNFDRQKIEKKLIRNWIPYKYTNILNQFFFNFLIFWDFGGPKIYFLAGSGWLWLALAGSGQLNSFHFQLKSFHFQVKSFHFQLKSFHFH